MLKDTIVAVEIEINSRCNRKCSYCPVSILPAPKAPKMMSEQVISRILEELARLPFEGRLSYHFYNEPLIRRDLEQIIKRFAERLPNAYQVLYTNGQLLTQKRYESLIQAGIHLIKITSHNLQPH